MAEINSTPRKNNGLVKKMIKKSTKVDLTPMVDLGFLLITFFVFTTTMAEPKVLHIDMPNDKDITVSNNLCESCTLTLVLGENNKIYFYEGFPILENVKETNFSAQGLRTIILNKKSALKKSLPDRKVELIIKASNSSTMQNLVNAIDETKITGLPIYYLDELTAFDKSLLQHN